MNSVYKIYESLKPRSGTSVKLAGQMDNLEQFIKNISQLRGEKPL